MVETDFSVFPLHKYSDVHISQKCVIPFSSSINRVCYGSWAKCTLKSAVDNKQIGFAVCQLYQQSKTQQTDNFAFMDTSVTMKMLDPIGEDIVMSKIESLFETNVNAVDIVVFITKDFFKKRQQNCNIKQLNIICKMLLQTYGLTGHCRVRSQELLQRGIKAININAIDCNENCFYFINDDTKITIVDIRFICEEKIKQDLKFYSTGFQSTLFELDDLLERSKNINLRTCLNTLIVGPSGCGKTTLITHFVKKHKCNYFHMLIKDILGQYPGETENKLRKLFDAAQLFVEKFKPKKSTIIHLEDLHLLCPPVKMGNKDTGTTLRVCAQLCSLLDKLNKLNTKIICMATTIDSKSLHKSLRSPGRFQHEIEIESLTDTNRKQLFEIMFNEKFSQQQLGQDVLDLVIAHTNGYLVADLALLIRNIEQTLLHDDGSLEISKLIIKVLKKSIPASLRNNEVTIIKSNEGFEVIGGMTTLKNTLKLNILTGLQRAEAYKRFSLSLPKGILLYGPPGCAKTTIAKCLAAEAQMTFITTSGAEVYSPYVGCAEKFIVKLFDTARKHSPCLIFLDEIDTLVGSRSLGNNLNSSSDIQTRILSTLLTEMDGIVQTRAAANAYILIVAATNRPNMIDDALLRPGRFDQLIHVPAPDYESRLSILELHKRHLPFSNDCDLSKIAKCTENFSGADICNLCNEAAMYAFQRDFNAKNIIKNDFDNVLLTLKPSLTQKQIETFYDFKNHRLR